MDPKYGCFVPRATQLSEQLTDYCTCTQPIYNLAQTTTSPPTVLIYLAPLHPIISISTLHILPTANQPIQCFTCYIVFTSPPWHFFCRYLPYLTSFAHIVYRLVSTGLLTVCLFYSMCNCVVVCRTALLYLGQVAIVNEDLFSNCLPG